MEYPKYPKIDGENLDCVNRRRFDHFKKAAVYSISFDNKENKLNLTKEDIELLAWNLATYNIEV